MSGRDVDGGYKSSLFTRHYASERRRKLRAAKLCINGGKHGAANPTSGKCDDCEATARRSR